MAFTSVTSFVAFFAGEIVTKNLAAARMEFVSALTTTFVGQFFPAIREMLDEFAMIRSFEFVCYGDVGFTDETEYLPSACLMKKFSVEYNVVGVEEEFEATFEVAYGGYEEINGFRSDEYAYEFVTGGIQEDRGEFTLIMDDFESTPENVNPDAGFVNRYADAIKEKITKYSNSYAAMFLGPIVGNMNMYGGEGPVFYGNDVVFECGCLGELVNDLGYENYIFETCGQHLLSYEDLMDVDYPIDDYNEVIDTSLLFDEDSVLSECSCDTSPCEHDYENFRKAVQLFDVVLDYDKVQYVGLDELIEVLDELEMSEAEDLLHAFDVSYEGDFYGRFIDAQENICDCLYCMTVDDPDAFQIDDNCVGAPFYIREMFSDYLPDLTLDTLECYNTGNFDMVNHYMESLPCDAELFLDPYSLEEYYVYQLVNQGLFYIDDEMDTTISVDLVDEINTDPVSASTGQECFSQPQLQADNLGCCIKKITNTKITIEVADDPKNQNGVRILNYNEQKMKMRASKRTRVKKGKYNKITGTKTKSVNLPPQPTYVDYNKVDGLPADGPIFCVHCGKQRKTLVPGLNMCYLCYNSIDKRYLFDGERRKKDKPPTLFDFINAELLKSGDVETNPGPFMAKVPFLVKPTYDFFTSEIKLSCSVTEDGIQLQMTPEAAEKLLIGEAMKKSFAFKCLCILVKRDNLFRNLRAKAVYEGQLGNRFFGFIKITVFTLLEIAIEYCLTELIDIILLRTPSMLVKKIFSYINMGNGISIGTIMFVYKVIKNILVNTLIMCGDIELNPGPECMICYEVINDCFLKRICCLKDICVDCLPICTRNGVCTVCGAYVMKFPMGERPPCMVSIEYTGEVSSAPVPKRPFKLRVVESIESVLLRLYRAYLYIKFLLSGFNLEGNIFSRVVEYGYKCLYYCAYPDRLIDEIVDYCYPFHMYDLYISSSDVKEFHDDGDARIRLRDGLVLFKNIFCCSVTVFILFLLSGVSLEANIDKREIDFLIRNFSFCVECRSSTCDHIARGKKNGKNNLPMISCLTTLNGNVCNVIYESEYLYCAKCDTFYVGNHRCTFFGRLRLRARATICSFLKGLELTSYFVAFCVMLKFLLSGVNLEANIDFRVLCPYLLYKRVHFYVLKKLFFKNCNITKFTLTKPFKQSKNVFFIALGTYHRVFMAYDRLIKLLFCKYIYIPIFIYLLCCGVNLEANIQLVFLLAEDVIKNQYSGDCFLDECDSCEEFTICRFVHRLLFDVSTDKIDRDCKKYCLDCCRGKIKKGVFKHFLMSGTNLEGNICGHDSCIPYSHCSAYRSLRDMIEFREMSICHRCFNVTRCKHFEYAIKNDYQLVDFGKLPLCYECYDIIVKMGELCVLEDGKFIFLGYGSGVAALADLEDDGYDADIDSCQGECDDADYQLLDESDSIDKSIEYCVCDVCTSVKCHYCKTGFYPKLFDGAYFCDKCIETLYNA